MTNTASNPHDASSEPGNGSLVRHVGTRVAGAVLGMVLALGVLQIPFDFSGDLQQARELGIVSLTVLTRYPARMDMITYLAVLGFPIMLGALFWYAGCCRHNCFHARRADPNAGMPVPDKPRWHLPAILTGLAILAMVFNINSFFVVSGNPMVGHWSFLGEEGASLAWAQQILNGGVYGRDFFCLYGPMYIYPLAWVMDLFGPHLVVERVLKFVWDLAGYGIVMATLYRGLRHRWIFVAGALLLPVFFPLSVTQSLNNTFLRASLGFLPILLTYEYCAGRSRLLLVLAGMTTGAAILFSQEVGICAAAACTAMVVLDGAMAGTWRRMTAALAIAVGAGLAAVAPMLLHLAINDALPAFIDSLVGYPRLVMLGFGNLPFPSFSSLLRHPLTDDRFIIYTPIFVFIMAALHVLPRLVRRETSPRLLLQAGLLVFGVLFFRVALGRSGLPATMRVMPVVLLLSATLVDGAWAAFRCSGSMKQRTAPAMMMAVLAAIFVLGWLSSPYLRSLTNDFFFRNVWNPHKWQVVTSGQPVESRKRISGIRFQEDAARDIRQIGVFIDTMTRPDDFVYFFPGEAAYYFVFDRRNPTRYALSCFAVTAQQRLELVADLKSNRPRYVVYSLNTYRHDFISEHRQVPEVIDYLKTAYRPLWQTDQLIVLERRAADDR